MSRGGGTVLVQVPLTAATRERSVSDMDKNSRLDEDDDEVLSGTQTYMYWCPLLLLNGFIV